MIKKIISILVILSAVFITLGCTDTSSNTQPAETETQESTPEQTPATYKIGDRVVVGDRAYTVTDVKTTAFVGDEYTKREAVGVYALISMTIENIGKESSTMISSDVKIVDDQGRTFESDSNAWIALKDNILLKQIQPGLPVKGETVFDVPKGINATLQVTDGGLFTDPVSISLGTIQ